MGAGKRDGSCDLAASCCDHPSTHARRAVGSPLAMPHSKSTRGAGRYRVVSRTVAVNVEPCRRRVVMARRGVMEGGRRPLDRRTFLRELSVTAGACLIEFPTLRLAAAQGTMKLGT